MRAGPRGGDRARGAGAAQSLLAVAGLEQRDEERRAERVARRGAVDGRDGRRRGAGHLHPVLEQDCSLGAEGERDEPRLRSDARSFTGTVSSSGVTNLNFANSGLVGKVAIQLGQAVKAGQVLATETSPSTTAAISADRASITADQASLAELKVSGTQASIAAAGARLAQDQAQLASDKVKLAETQIIAPSAGTVIAINGQAGETVTAAGIRSYASQSQTSGSQSPPFSLLPEGPAASVKSSSSQSALPMIALRTLSSWQVTVLVPESGIQQVHPSQEVMVAVPAVGLNGVRGTIQQVSPTPVSTSIGTAYQAIVRISGHQRVTPLGGMTANVQLAS